MKYSFALMALVMGAFLSSKSYAQLPVKPLASQSELLKSDDPNLAKNKRLVYDMWREFLEAGHLDKAEKYLTEDYMQHNPLAATGRKAVVEFFSRFSTPKEIVDSIKTSVVSIVAEKDLVVISFARELPDPQDKTKKYTTTWFDMFRIENGKIAEHWDCATK